MAKQLQKSYVPQEVIKDQLLMALDDKSKVAVVLDATDLQFLISAVSRYVNNKQASRLEDGFRQLQAAAFGGAKEEGK